jgi:hypothetical protein
MRHVLASAKERWSASSFKNTTRHRISCASCEKGCSKVHWVVLGVDHIAGPWCIRCLRNLVWTEIERDKGLKQDLYVLALTATAYVLRRVHNVKIEHEATSGDEPEIVF